MIRITDDTQIVSGFVPVDMSAAANTGDWVSLKHFGSIAVVLFKAAGTAGDDPTLTIQQAQDVAGTGAKALNFTKIYVKQGTLTSVGTWTINTQSAANTYTDATSAEAQAIWLVNFNADELDVDNGFHCVQMSVADIGTNAQLGCGIYLLRPAAYAQENPPSAIA